MYSKKMTAGPPCAFRKISAHHRLQNEPNEENERIVWYSRCFISSETTWHHACSCLLQSRSEPLGMGSWAEGAYCKAG